MEFIKNLFNKKSRKSIYSLLIGLALTYIVFSLITSNWTILFFGIKSGFNRMNSISQIVSIFTFILLIALGFSIASKTGLIDISIPGKILLSSIISFITVYQMRTSSHALILIVFLLMSFTISTIISLFMIFLKNKFKVNEVIFGIIINLVVAFIYIALTRGSRFPWIDEYGSIYSFGYLLNFDKAELKYMTWFVFIGIALAIIMYVFYKWTSLGFKMTVIGKSQTVGKTVGINTTRVYLMSVLMISGFVALGTLVYVFGVQNGTLDATLNAAPAEAFSAMAVTSLSNANPLGILFNTLIFATTNFSKDYIELTTDLNKNVIDIITGVLMVVISITPYLISKMDGIWKSNSWNEFRKKLFSLFNKAERGRA